MFGKEGQSARRSLVDVALAESANFFDTSPEAGEADGILASSLTGRRRRAIIAAAIPTSNSRLSHAQIDRALRLFEGRIDILFADSPQGWEWFQPVARQMKSDGHLTAAGILCLDAASYPRLIEILRTDRDSVDAIQVAYNPADSLAARDVLPLAARLDIGVVVAQPFGAGRLLELDGSESILGPLRRLGVSDMPQAILKWILSDPRITSVLPGTRRNDHLLANLRAGTPPWMSPEDRRMLADVMRLRLHAHDECRAI